MSVAKEGTRKPKQVKRPRIYCIEGAWSGQQADVRTVAPVLEALTAVNQIRAVRRHVSSTEDLEHQFRQWGRAHHKAYTIGYMALHGSPGAVWVGNTRVGLSKLAEWSEGNLHGKDLHFDSCQTLRTTDSKLQDFLANTGLRSITGFRKDVYWFESLALETLLFDALTSYSRISNVQKYLDKVAGNLVERTGFVVVTPE